MITASDIFGPDDLPPIDTVSYHETLQRAIMQERARREAKRLLDADARTLRMLPAVESLRERLARGISPVRYRIDGWQPESANVVLAAQFKAGKTTLRDNYVRSIVDGDPWLGMYTVSPITAGTVAIFDVEMSEAQGLRWLQEQAIRNDDRVLFVSLRGRAASFNILDEDVRRRWAALLEPFQVDTLILDCVRPLTDALGLDEHKDGGLVLAAIDALKVDAGIANAVVVHHMGHLGERSRGDSRFRDWPDVEWRLVRQDEDPASARFITAYGRDVDIPESQLEYDALRRRLTIAGGTRRDAVHKSALDSVLSVIDGASERLSGRAIKNALKESDHSREAIEGALKFGIRTSALAIDSGPKNAKLYRRSVPVPASVPAASQDTESVRPSAYRHGTLGRALETLASVPDFHFDNDPFGSEQAHRSSSPTTPDISASRSRASAQAADDQSQDLQ